MVEVRAATREDAAIVAGIGRVAFEKQYEGLMDATNYTIAADRWYAPDAIAELIVACRDDPHAHFLVAERDGRVVGFLHYDEFGAEPELHRIYLAESERGRGTGTSLMDALHARLPSGAEYILAVVDGNEGAVRFYRRHGLSIDRRVSGKNYYRETAGLELPDTAEDFGLIIMRYGGSRASSDR